MRKKILVANLGSTSYKYTLFHATADDLQTVAKGKYERVTDHGEVIAHSLEALINAGHLASLDDLDAVGFKTVMGGDVSGCRLADDVVLAALERTAPLAPAHNPPYAAGIRQFARVAPKVPRVVLFETAFYQWVNPVARRYAVPKSWYEAGVRRYGFHGASHKFIAERSAQLLGRDDVVGRVQNLYAGELPAFEGKPLRVISCHLGGSSSVTAIKNGTAIGTSMGLSPQSGLPQNNRVGDLDTMAIPFALRHLGLSLDEVEAQLTKQGGLLGLSGGLSNDMRDLRAGAAAGNADAQVALDFLNHEIRRWASSFLFDLGGLDAICFTGGIGEFDTDVRAAVCQGLEFLGLKLDTTANAACLGKEQDIATADSAVRVLVIPANEEAVIATETQRFLLRQA